MMSMIIRKAVPTDIDRLMQICIVSFVLIMTMEWWLQLFVLFKVPILHILI